MKSPETIRAEAKILVDMVNLVSGKLMEGAAHDKRLKSSYTTANQLITELRGFLLITEKENL